MRHNRLSLILILASLIFSLVAAADMARPVSAVTSGNAGKTVISTTGDHYVYESSYQNPGFYAQGLFWVFYEDSSVSCEHHGGCLFYTTSSDGVHFSSSKNVGIHVTDSDWSTATNGTYVFYARYNETSFQSTANRALLFGMGKLNSAGIISWNPEQIVRQPDPSLEFPNENIGIDTNGQVWIGYQQDNASGGISPRIIHSVSKPPSPLSSRFAISPTNPTTSQTVEFNATAVGGTPGYNFAWTFGDGSTGSGQNAAHTYAVPQNYTVTLTTSDSSNPQQSTISTEVISVDLLVPSKNTPPILSVPTSFGTKVGVPISFVVSASDSDGDSVGLSNGTLPSGAAFNQTTGQFVWIPAQNQSNQIWVLSFTATDNNTLSVTNQVLVYVSPLWIADFGLASPTGGNWHVDIAALGAGQIYAAYWAEGQSLQGKLYDGTNWGTTEQISSISTSTDVNSFIFSPGANVSAIYFDTNTQNLYFSSRGPSGGWGPDLIGKGEAKSASSLPGSNPDGSPNGQGRYSLPFTAAFDQADSQFYVFWYNDTNHSIDEWSGAYSTWRQTANAFSTGTAVPESAIGSFHYSSPVGSRNAFGILWVDGSGPTSYNLNFGLETVGSLGSPTTDPSWNPRVGCTATVVTIEQILGGQNNSLGGATESGSIFNPGITAASPGDAKRWLNPPCTITNADGQIVSAFVEIDGVQHGFLTQEDNATHYDPVNGGASYSSSILSKYPHGLNDTTFNIFTPGYLQSGLSCSASYLTGCMHTIHVEFDHDWKAAGYCGPPTNGTVCDASVLAGPQGAGANGPQIDVQGFIYWDPDHASDPFHAYSGWELHPLTAWRLSNVPSGITLGANPPSLAIAPGTSANTTITVTNFNLFNGSLPITTNAPPGGPAVTFSRSTILIPACNYCTVPVANMTISAATTNAGVYVIKVIAGSGVGARSVNVTAFVGGFKLSAQPPSLTIPAGSSLGSTIIVSSLGGFSGTVNLSPPSFASGSCTCITAQLNTTNVVLTAGGSKNVALTVTAGSQTGNARVIVTGASTSTPPFSASTIINVTGVDFSVTANPSSAAFLVNSPANSTITTAAINGFAGTVTLTKTVPTGLSCSLSPTVITLSQTTTFVSSTLSCSGSAGNYVVIVTGNSTGILRSATFNISFQDYTIAAIPTSLMSNAGSPASSTIRVTAVNGFTGTIAFSQNGGSSCGLSAPNVALTSTITTATISLTCTYSTTGNNLVKIGSVDGPISHNATVTFQIVDFTISASLTNLTVNVGSLGNSTISLGRLNGFNGTIVLTDTPQSGLSCSLSSSNINLATNQTSAILSCKSPNFGSYTVTVTGTNGSLSHSTVSILLHVVDFTLEPSTLSLSSTVGGTQQTTENLVSVNGFAGTVTFNVAISPSVGSGPSATFSPNPVSLSSTGCGCASAIMNVIAGQAAGTFSLNVTATNGLLTHWKIITLTVTSGKTALTTSLTPTSLIVGNTATDSATLTGATASAGGTVTYYLFPNSGCTGQATPVSVVTVTSGVAPNSRAVYFNATGSYGFNATYSGDANNQPASSSCEPLTVTKISPTLVTTIKDSSNTPVTTVPVGTTVHDSAVINGGFRSNGTITYTVFSNGVCSGLGSIIGSPGTVTNGLVPDSIGVTPTGAGLYSFNATYSGDSNNYPAKSPCEPLTVSKLTPVISTSINPTSTIIVGSSATDQASLTGGYPSTGVTGTVTYNFFNNGFCSGIPTSSQSVPVGPSDSVPVSSAVTPSPAGSYAFNATYNGDSNNTRASSPCEPLTVQKASPTISTLIKNSSGTPVTSVTVGTSVHDSSTLPGGFASITGTVTYEFFSDGACTASGTPAGTATISGGVVPDSSAFTPTIPGSYSFNATYNGDQNNNKAASSCEPLSVTAKLSPTLTTVVRDSTGAIVSSVNFGAVVHDNATLTGGSTVITGTVTYYFFSNNVCTGTPSSSFPPFPQTVSVGGGNSVPGSANLTPSSGLYSFNATYSGDSTNNRAVSTCEPLTVKADPTLATIIKNSSNTPVGTVVVGSTVHDTAALTGANSNAGGTVTYTIFSNGACIGTGTTVSTATVTAGVVQDSIGSTSSLAGSYSFNATYSGDVVDNPTASPCEPLTVARASPVLGTVVRDSSNSPVTTIIVGASIHDTATLTGGFSPGGLVTYTNFSTSSCAGTGTSVGSPVSVTNGSVPDSSAVIPQPAGSFSFNVTYNGDANNNGVSTCEPFTVLKASPTISTTINPSSTITVGSSATDQATIAGGFPTTGVSGTVSYGFYSNGICSGTPVSSQTVTITVGNSVPASPPATPTAAGVYSFNATYNGDANNNRIASTCEPLTVGKQTPTLTTSLSPPSSIVVGTAVSDQATISGGFPSTGMTGTVTYNFFSNGLCTGLPSSSQPVLIGTNNSVPSSNSITPSPAGSYAMNATYSGDSNNNPTKSACEPFTVAKATPSLTTNITPSSTVVLGTSVTDHATVAGGFPLSGVTGSVTYQFFNNGLCTGLPASSQTVTVGSGNSVPASGSQTPTSTGQYGFNATYAGDANNNAASSGCELLTITPPATTLTTTIKTASQSSVTTITVGTAIHDTAVLTGSTSTAGGTVTYNFYTNGICSGTPNTSQTVTVSNNIVPDSSSTTPTPAGTYSYNATYSGDVNNQPAKGACEPLSVTKASASVSTSLSSTSAFVGKPVSDSATLTGGFSPTGTVTFNTYLGTVCTGTPYSSNTISLVSTTAGPTTVIFNATGTFNWQAVYNGDINNLASSSSCGSETVTVLKTSPSITTTLSTGTVVVGNPVTDLATITNGFAPTGTVTFNVYTGTVCTGTPVASKAAQVISANAGPISFIINSTGTFSFQANYEGDANNSPVSSTCGTETLTVTKATSTVTTTLGATTITVDNPGSDTATVSGFNPTGSVTFNVYSGTSCTGTAIASKTIAVTGTTAGPVSVVFNSTGTYNWQASYGGDSNNNPSSSTCGSETLTVGKTAPAITTALSSSSVIVGNPVTDSATISNGFGATGTITFNVYSGNVCTGLPIASKDAPLSGTTAGPVTVVLNATGTFNWQAVYTGDSNNGPASSACGTETLTVLRTSPTTLTTLGTNTIVVGGSVTDSASVSGAFSPTGSVTFNVYSGSACSGTPYDTRTVGIISSGSAGPVSITFNNAGSYTWQATYSGDSNNNPSSSTCGSENLAVSKATPSVSTTQSVSSVSVGSSASDTATLSLGFGPTGVVTFSIYSGTVCTGTPVTSIVSTLSGSSAGPVSAIFNATGTYNWLATYGGDANNNPASTTCGTEVLTVTKLSPSVATTLSKNSIVVGGSVSDSASITGGFTPTGLVSFNIYSGSVCTGAPVATRTAAIASGNAGPVTVTLNSTGVYNWQAVYPGDSNNNGASSQCGSETVSVGGVLVVSTTLSSSSTTVGTSSSDSATVSGGLSPTGTVAFNVYSGTGCTGTPIASKTLPLVSSSAGPFSVVFNSTGVYNWQATYNGDANNGPTSSSCGSETLTVAKATPTVSTTLSSNTIMVGNTVIDTATVSGFSPTGTVTFNVYSGTACSGTPFDSRTVALSTSGSAGPVSALFNTAGTYNWQATYNGDGNNNLASSSCGTETLDVTKAPSTVSTTLSTNSVTVNNSVSDTATVSGFNPTGSVLFDVYSGTSCTGTLTASKTVVLAGSTAGPVSIIFNSTGTYNWQASYSGDPNNSPATSTCGSETLTVAKTTPTINTSLSTGSIIVGNSVSDSATVSGGFSPTGTVTFNVYSGPACTGVPVASRVATLTGSTTGPVNVFFNATGTFNWQASYGGDSNNGPASSPCGSEILNVQKTTPSIITTLGSSSITVGTVATDSASVSGAFSPTGFVVFNVYLGSACSGNPYDTRTVTISTSGSTGPVSITFNSAGSYTWQASYVGDSNNSPASSLCGSENLTVNKASPSVSTTLSVSSTSVGSSVSDTATVVGGFGPTGAVTFSIYSGTACSGTPIANVARTLTGSTAGPASVVFNATGTYNWQATYGGDANNNQVSSTCGSETLIITKLSPTITTSLSKNSIVAGGSDSDSATVSGGFNPTGLVVFNVYSGSFCTSTPVATRNAVITANNAGPITVVLNTTGVYNWQAVYNGDSNNNAASSQCGSETVSVGGVLVVSTSLSSTTATVGNSVSDTASISGGLSPTGTVTFNVYFGTGCTGSPIATNTLPIASNSAGPFSVTFNSTGTYNWQATYNGDSNNGPTSSACGSENLTINKGTPTVSTTLSGNTIVVGNTAADSAIVSGFSPTGTVTFNVFSGPLCSGSPYDTKTVALSTSSSAGPVIVQFSTSGTFNWQATYNGDGNNNVASSPCGSETLAVTKATPNTSTTLSVLTVTIGNSVSDSASVSGGFSPTGSVTFRVYSGTVCSGTPISTQTAILSSSNAGPVNVIVNNTGTLNWQATYNGDANNNVVSSACGTETLTVVKTGPALATSLSSTTSPVGSPVTDLATLSNSFSPTGTVAFNVYPGTVCSGAPVASQSATISGTTAGPVSVTFNATGTYSWQAAYNGDANNNAATSNCGSETLTVNKVTPTITTTLSSNSVTVGSLASDSASVGNGFATSGTVTFNVYSGSVCSGSAMASRTVGLTANSAGPVSVVLNSTGTYTWQATYNGDANNNAATSPCGFEVLTVQKFTASITTALASSSVIVGTPLSDTASMSGFSPSGTVTFSVYAGAQCTGTALASKTVPINSGSAGPVSVVFNSTGVYNWQAAYNGDSNNSVATSSCGTESLTVTKATPSITTSLSDTTIAVHGAVTDTATVSAGFGSTGTVTFRVYLGTSCSGTPVAIQTATLVSASAGPVSVTFNSTGTYNWQATYNGDSNNNIVSSVCGTETVSVGGALVVTTNLSSSSATVGTSVSDMATLTGGVTPTGSVTFNIYSSSACSGTSIAAKTAALTSGSAGPVSVVFNSTGSYGWEAKYNGDAKNSPTFSTCEPLSITKASPSISTTLSGSTIIVGSSATDTATLANGYGPTGTVTFNVYFGSSCAGTPIATRTSSVSSSTTGPVSVAFNSTGTYNFQASYGGDLNNNPATSPCGSEALAVNLANTSLTTTLSTNAVIVGGSVTDSASLSGGFNPTGMVTFNLYAGSVCTGIPVSTQTVNLTGSSAGPVSFTLNTASNYQVLASYNGDQNNQAATSACGSESITVSPASPTISTTLSKPSGLVGDTVTDSGAVTGGFKATGSVTFNVYPGLACAGTPLDSGTVALSTSGTAGPLGITFTTPGSYTWQAVYSGDANNNPATSLCGSELLTINKATPSVVTTLSVQNVVVGNSITDGAVLSGGYTPTGTVTFNVYQGTSCTGNPLASQTAILSSGSAGPVSVTFTSTGTYNWQATYTGDGNNNVASSACGSETLTVTKSGPSVSTALSDSSVIVGSTVIDSATVSGGFNPTGTVTFNVYLGPICTGTPFASRTTALSTSGSAGPVSALFNSVGTYNWQASYGGDSNNLPATSTCGTETLVVARATPTITTSLSSSSIIVGTAATDTASVNGGYLPTGTVTINVYSGTSCTGPLFATNTFTLSSGSAGPAAVTFTTAGTYTWQATYNGDGNNNAVSSVCGSEPLTVSKAVPSVSTSLSTGSVIVGTTAADSASVTGGFNPTGTVTFSVYPGTVCVGSPVASRTLLLSTGSAGPYPVTFNTTGTFSWQAVYNGDNNNQPNQSLCGTETLTVAKATPTVTTSLSQTSIVVGNSAADSATITGGFAPTGTVTFNLFAGTTCSAPVATQTSPITSSNAGPFTVSINSTGTFTWQANYNGDSNNNPVSSSCGSETLTVLKTTPTVTTSLSTNTIVVGNSAADQATVSGFNPAGTVTFTVYSGSLCSGTVVATNAFALPTSGVAGPDSVSFVNAGQYAWQATYGGDSNNNPASSTCGSELLTVSKATPTVSTTLQSSSIVVGGSDSDTATVTGGLSPSGTVTFRLYTGSTCTSPALVTKSVSLIGNTAGPVNVVFNASGTVNWQATYNGDANNNVATSPCGTESLTIGKASPSIATSLSKTVIAIHGSVSDSASIAGGFNPTGTVTFTVYQGTVCSGTVVFTQTATLTGTTAGPVTFQFNSVGVYNWVAAYSGDSNNSPVSSGCGSETVSVGGALAVSTSLSSGSAVVGSSVSDTATITGGVSPTGTVTFNVYSGTCSGTILATKTVPLNSGQAGPVSVTFTSAGAYGWNATYDGDSNNNPTAGACESLTITQMNPTITTSLSSNPIQVGGSVTDSATLNNSFNPTGTVTYDFFSGGACAGTPTSSQIESVGTGGTVPVSPIVTPSSAGSYAFNAAYSGDANNNRASSPCEPLTVNMAAPTLTTTLSSTTINAGQSVADASVLAGGYNIGGTVIYEYFTGSTCTGTATTVGSPVAIIGGAVPNSQSQTFMTAGSFSWNALYSGDANNIAAPSSCEALVVQPTNPSISTTLTSTNILVGGSVADSAVLSGSTPDAAGTVTYSIFGEGSCSGTTTITFVVSVVHGIVPNSPPQTFGVAGSYSWRANYSGDSNNNPSAASCEPMQVGKASSTVTTTLSSTHVTVGGSVSDSASLTASPGASGTVTYQFFTGSICSGTPTPVGSPAAVSASIPSSALQTFNSAGPYSWDAVYSGDPNNAPATSSCEPLAVTKATPVLANSLSKTAITAGDSVTESAILSAGFQAGGSVTYQYFTGSTCAGSPTVIGAPVTLTNGAIPVSVAQAFANARSYSLGATYSGDSNNLPAPGQCLSLTVYAKPTLSLPSPPSVTAGTLVHFVVNATGADGCNGVTLSASDLPAGASFASTQCFSGSASSIFSWTPTQAGDFKVTFTATDSRGSIATSQLTIHVTAPQPSSSLPLVQYSIFGLVGFLIVIVVAVVLRRVQTPKRKAGYKG